jgi:tetratricopeptide (TPR) repeat protein
MAARAIANAEGNAAIAFDQTVRLTTKTEKNFGRFVEFGEQISIRLDDVRRTKAGEDGKFSVGLKLTIKARKKEIQYEMVSMKLRDNAEGQEQPRWWMSSASDGMVPVFGSGKLKRGKMVSGWVTFHGIDEQVKWPSLDYHPMWEPNAFAAGLADDLTADLSALDAEKPDAKDEAVTEKTPPLKAPTAKKTAKKAGKKSAAKRVVTKRKKRSSEPRIVSKDPLAKARHYVKKRDSRRVLTEARRVLKKAPGNGEAHYLMGWAQVQMGTFQSARQSLSKATSLGAPPDAWYNLGLAYQMLGDDGKAIKALQRFVALAPGHKNAAMARETLEALQ